MGAAIILKRLSAIFLAIALFLPLAKLPMPDSAAPEPNIVYTGYSAYDVAESAHKWMGRLGILPLIIICFAFLWPLVLTVASFVRRDIDQRLPVHLFEAFLCIGSGFVVSLFIFNGKTPLYGAFVASAAIATYFITSLREIVVHARRKRLRQT